MVPAPGPLDVPVAFAGDEDRAHRLGREHLRREHALPAA